MRDGTCLDQPQCNAKQAVRTTCTSSCSVAVTVVSATNLPKESWCVSCTVPDPRVRIRFQGATICMTSTEFDDANPVWNHECALFQAYDGERVTVELWDDDGDYMTAFAKNMVGLDATSDGSELLGNPTVVLRETTNNSTFTLQLQAGGEIQLRIHTRCPKQNGPPYACDSTDSHCSRPNTQYLPAIPVVNIKHTTTFTQQHGDTTTGTQAGSFKRMDCGASKRVVSTLNAVLGDGKGEDRQFTTRECTGFESCVDIVQDGGRRRALELSRQLGELPFACLPRTMHPCGMGTGCSAGYSCQKVYFDLATMPLDVSSQRWQNFVYPADGQPRGICVTNSELAAPLQDGVPGHAATTEKSARACQARCAATRGCAHYTYGGGTGGTDCHLLGPEVKAVAAGGMVSGPASCREQRTCANIPATTTATAVEITATAVETTATSAETTPAESQFTTGATSTPDTSQPTSRTLPAAVKTSVDAARPGASTRATADTAARTTAAMAVGDGAENMAARTTPAAAVDDGVGGEGGDYATGVVATLAVVAGVVVAFVMLYCCCFKKDTVKSTGASTSVTIENLGFDRGVGRTNPMFVAGATGASTTADIATHNRNVARKAAASEYLDAPATGHGTSTAVDGGAENFGFSADVRQHSSGPHDAPAPPRRSTASVNLDAITGTNPGYEKFSTVQRQMYDDAKEMGGLRHAECLAQMSLDARPTPLEADERQMPRRPSPIDDPGYATHTCMHAHFCSPSSVAG